MDKVTIYYLRYYDRDFHHLLHELVETIQIKYNAKIVHTLPNGMVTIDGIEVQVADCEILIHFENTDSFKCVSFCDNQSQLIAFFLNRNNPNDLVVYSQYAACTFYSNNVNFRWKPGIYVPSMANIYYSNYYDTRKSLDKFIDKFYFKGNVIGTNRNSVLLLADNEWFFTGNNIPHEDYLSEALRHKVGLSIPGLGELCYRDIEYMGIGLPMMKFEYVTQLNPPLIPNFHYIAIDRIPYHNDAHNDKTNLAISIIKERDGGIDYAQKYVERFLEVKDDYEFLQFISKNAKEYYDTYLCGANRLTHMLNLLEL